MFKEGDVVRLKSGGPKMTVNSKGGGDTLHCSWFVDGDAIEHKGMFKSAALDLSLIHI